MTPRPTQPKLPDTGGWRSLVDVISKAATLSATGGADDSGRLTWAAAGLGQLTVDAAGRGLEPSGPFVDRMNALAGLLPVKVEPLQLLSERSAIAGLRGRPRRGGAGNTPAQSVGGTAWIVAASDGWFCINLARREDAESLPALLECDIDHRDWDLMLSVFRQRSVAELDDRSMLLGLPASVIPGTSLAANVDIDPQLSFRQQGRLTSPFLVEDLGEARAVSGRPVVLDLTSLWAGPLCGSLLAAAGCRVIKVEGRRRPDGARAGPQAFFDLMNGGKECIAVDFADADDRQALDELLEVADVVLEGSRPRVMEGLGIDPVELVQRRRSCWVSVTAFGRTGPWSNRVGFGDDIAAGAGVVARQADTLDFPTFVADAIADPVGGCVAAAAAWHALSTGRAAVVDLALREALGFLWGSTVLSSQGDLGERAQELGVRQRDSAAARAFDADGTQIREELRRLG